MKPLSAEAFLERNPPVGIDVAGWPRTVEAEAPYRCQASLYPTMSGLKTTCSRNSSPERKCLCVKLGLRVLPEPEVLRIAIHPTPTAPARREREDEQTQLFAPTT